MICSANNATIAIRPVDTKEGRAHRVSSAKHLPRKETRHPSHQDCWLVWSERKDRPRYMVRPNMGKETLHRSHGDSERSGSLSRVIERKRSKGRIHTTHLATDRQALRPSPNHNCIENTGRCNDGLEHFSDARITHFESVDEQFWKWDEAIECNLCSTDPFKLDWKP